MRSASEADRAPPETIEDLVQTSGGGSASSAGRADLQPPGARQVAQRALVLRALMETGLFPRAGESPSAADLQFFDRERTRLVEWLRRAGAWEEASETEKRVLQTPVGKLERSDLPDQSAEHLVVMLWALGKTAKLPRFDAAAPPGSSLQVHIPRPGSPAGDFLNRAQLRSEEEIAVARQAAEVWSWRAMARQVAEEQRFPEGQELDEQVRDLQDRARAEQFRLGPIRDGAAFFRELVRFASNYYHQQGLLPAPFEDDFPALGKSYAELTQREYERLRRIARERLRGLNWLSGYAAGGGWDAVPVDT